MFEFVGGYWPSVASSTPETPEQTPLLDDPRVDMWVAQEITSSTEEANRLMFLRWRYRKGDFDESV